MDTKRNSKKLIVKSNKLVEASYRLTASEQRLIYMLISKIKKDDTEFKEYEFSISEIVDFLELKGESYYSELKKITRELISKTVSIQEPDGVLQVSWFTSAKYHDNTGTVSLCFAPRLKPYLLKLKEKFTKFELKNVIQLKSTYSMRLYELLKQYQPIGERTLELEELKKMLQITQKSYSIYNNFKQRVILKAQTELKEKTDIWFEFEEIKKKRKVTAIRFIIRHNETEPDQMTLDETISDEVQKKMDMLTAEGIEEEVAKKLVQNYSIEIINNNIKYSKDKNPQNIVAYIITAIEKDFANKTQQEKETAATSEDLKNKYKDLYMI